MEKVNCTHCGVANPATSKYCSQCGYELPKVKTEIIESPAQGTEKVPESKQKRIIRIVVSVLSFFITYFIIQEIFFKPPSFDKEMVKVANEINKNCPMTLDKETRLDNVEALPDHVFRYNYTLVNMEKSQIESSGIKEYLQSKISSDVQTNPDLKAFREHKTTMEYNYKDKNGIAVMIIRVEAAN